MEDALITTARAYEEGLRQAKRHGFYWGILATTAVTIVWDKYQEQKLAADKVKP